MTEHSTELAAALAEPSGPAEMAGQAETACPLTDVIEDQTQVALDGLVQDFRINWVWLPPWGPEKITEDGREQLRALGFNV
jgi:metal-sulfur cluster biosynthetic enzyme